VFKPTDVIDVVGYRDGLQVYSTQFTVLGTGPTLELFGWNVDKVFVYSHNGAAFLDDINLSGLRTAVPEPATWAFMLLGTAGVGMALRRSRRIEAEAA
jgi:hypothetical protein